jgi:hypothetical protein
MATGPSATGIDNLGAPGGTEDVDQLARETGSPDTC